VALLVLVFMASSCRLGRLGLVRRRPMPTQEKGNGRLRGRHQAGAAVDLPHRVTGLGSHALDLVRAHMREDPDGGHALAS
jgi:hypothetical protein